MTYRERPEKRNGPMWLILLTAVCVILNLAGAEYARMAGLPLFLDSAGTILASVTGGYLPGIIAGLLTNIIKGFSDPPSVYYGSVSAVIAVIFAFSAKRGSFRKFSHVLGFALLTAVTAGSMSSVLTWFLYGFAGEGISASTAVFLQNTLHTGKFASQLMADVALDMADKTVCVVAVYAVIQAMPLQIMSAPGESRTETAPGKKQGFFHGHSSLGAKITVFICVAVFAVAGTAIVIGTEIFRRTSVGDHEKIALGAASLMAEELDPEKVNEYISAGEGVPGYTDVEAGLEQIRESYPDIRYMYVYRIEPDGCRVVFDLDTEDTPGAEPGELIPFDESFSPYIGDLLDGKAVGPVVTDDTFGWLLTVYRPVYDGNGNCVCHTAVDISMGKLTDTAVSYAVRMISLFSGFLILILAIVLTFTKKSVTDPVNLISGAMSRFLPGSQEERRKSLEELEDADIHTGDEIETMYRASVKTMKNCVEYIDRINEQTEKMNRAQDGLITVLADVVESRDSCTGDHIRKTSAYVALILNEMKKRGTYGEVLTDEYVQSVIRSAPLHDVGKVQIPDAILNKPGKLTDEEYEIMKSHTLRGTNIIDAAMEIVPDPMYLKETRSIARHHHEKWDGTGYPDGLKGEEIPLSARVMAVADVFDALVSERSYKKGMPCEKAFGIIEEGSGTYFDPSVVEAFLGRRKAAEEIASGDVPGKT